MAICTKDEVFNFMQTGTAERANAGNISMVEALILSVEHLIERFIGRKVSSTPMDIRVHDGRFCSISGPYIFLNDIYFDIVEISSIEENGVELEEGTDFVWEGPNIIERIGTQWNASNQLAIKIVGLCGLVYDNSDTDTANYVALPDIKQIAIECVAIKSGMWVKNVTVGDGEQMEVQKSQLPKLTITQLQKYVRPTL